MSIRSVFLVRAVWSALFVSGLLLSGAFVPPVHAQATRTTDRVLFQFRSGVSAARAQAVLQAHGIRGARTLGRLGIAMGTVPAGVDSRLVARALAARPEVRIAEPDLMLRLAATPNDSYYGSQWHLKKIAAPTAWDRTTGAPSLVIAVLDAGCEATHPDLKDKLVPGWNFYNNNADTSPILEHGTMVAGAVAASSNNSVGVASPAWGCRIMPVRVSDPTGYCAFSAIASGLEFAADHGARIANVSVAAYMSSTVTTAAQYFRSKGGVVCMSAGNDGSATANANNPYVVVVGATNSTDTVCTWSVRGKEVDLVAPGNGVYVTRANGTYGPASGTSYSAPIVAGVAALVLSANPTLTPDQVQTILTDSADDLGTVGWDPDYGSGRVNAAKAVDLALSTGGGDMDPPSIQWNSPASGATLAGVVSLSVSASDNVGVAQVSFAANGASVGTDTSSPYAVSWDTTQVPNGTYTLTATAKDAAGNAGVASITVTVSNGVDATPPTVVITSPANGASVKGNVSVLVNATDNVGVVRVELYVDGILTATSTAAPFTTSWNSRKASSGNHILQTRAYDAQNNSALSQQVTVKR